MTSVMLRAQAARSSALLRVLFASLLLSLGIAAPSALVSTASAQDDFEDEFEEEEEEPASSGGGTAAEDEFEEEEAVEEEGAAAEEPATPARPRDADTVRGEKFRVADHIPFKETRDYVGRVLSARAEYRVKYKRELSL